MMDRRRFVGNALRLAAALPAASLTGCAAFWRAILDSCPENSSESGGVNWVPNVLHPVFYGFQDVTAADGAPGPARIWYPSVDGAPDGAPILKMCVVRWPVVLLLHGMPPPTGSPCAIPDYHKRWFTLPMTLARSGYVVVVPSYSPFLPQEPLGATDFPLPLIDWVRTSWANERWVDKRPELTAVAGHSFGALLAARVAVARPTIGAFVSLGAGWSELPSGASALIRSINRPSLFMFGRDLIFENMFDASLFDVAATPRYGAMYTGEHFDYIADIRDIAACSHVRGSCTRFERAAADLIALFISRFVEVPIAITNIPVDLNPSPVGQTDRQRFYSGGHITGDGRLVGLSSFSGSGCRIDLRWHDGTAPGSRVIGS